jgi:hypothetical protein
MATLMVDVRNDLDIEKIMSAISTVEGVNTVAIRPKTQTDILIERMIAGEDIDDNEYFDSIPGMWESIEAASNEPKENWVPIEEVWLDWKERIKSDV